MVMVWKQIKQVIMAGNRRIETMQAQRNLSIQHEVPRKVVDYLERVLHHNNMSSADNPQVTNDWLIHYQNIVHCLANITTDDIALQKIQTKLSKGQIGLAGESLDQLIDTADGRSVALQAALHYCRGKLDCLALQPHQALPHLQKAHHLLPDTFAYTFDVADVLHQQKSYDTSESLYIKLLRENESMADNERRAAILAKLGVLYGDTQRVTEAESAFMGALTLYQTLPKPNKQVIAKMAYLSHQLAELYRETYRVVYAEALYNEALILYRQLGEKTLQYQSTITNMLNELAELWREVGALDKLTVVEKQLTELQK